MAGNVLKLSLAFAATLSLSAPSALAQRDDVVECYGIAKAGENDGGTGAASRAGSATRHYQGNAYRYMPNARACTQTVTPYGTTGSTSPISLERQPGWTSAYPQR